MKAVAFYFLLILTLILGSLVIRNLVPGHHSGAVVVGLLLAGNLLLLRRICKG